MTEPIAGILLILIGAHLALGSVFAIAFQARGLARIDAAAARGTRGFRIAITPGVVALWPVLLRRWMQARDARP